MKFSQADGKSRQIKSPNNSVPVPLFPQSGPVNGIPAKVYASSPQTLDFAQLENNLSLCLAAVENEVLKSYLTRLSDLPVAEPDRSYLAQLDNSDHIQFFQITELVYEEHEFSVYKLATVLHTLSNKPCTVALLIHSDGHRSQFYLGVRSRDSRYSTGTMKETLQNSLTGLFPGSATKDIYQDELESLIQSIPTGCISGVTCVADYKQGEDKLTNEEFFQGLEKLIYSMRGTPFTAICLANNLMSSDIQQTRRELEEISTQLSPFANMQYNFSLNHGKNTSTGSSTGKTSSSTAGTSSSTGSNESVTKSFNTSTSNSLSNTGTINVSVSNSDGTSDSTSTSGSVGLNAGVGFAKIAKVGVSATLTTGRTRGESHSVSRSNSISASTGRSSTESSSISDGVSRGSSTQAGESRSESLSRSVTYSQTIAESFGQSQAVTLNVQNKGLLNIIARLDRQMKRLDECESVGMWDFAAYFLGESAHEAETAANIYQSIISGARSGVQLPAINTWTENAAQVAEYIIRFLHPVFVYSDMDDLHRKQLLVDPSALSSTSELAIQMGLPRGSVNGLPVIKHAEFAREIIKDRVSEHDSLLPIGTIFSMGSDTNTKAFLDRDALTMHTFVTGSTGSGKSNAVYELLDQLRRNRNIPFLVIEPAKGEYKNIFGQFEDVSVYGTNPKKFSQLLQLDPFSFPTDIHVLEHLDRLVEIFNVCWPMEAAMPAILKEATERAYCAVGWDMMSSRNQKGDVFPNFSDLFEQLDQVVENSGYSAENKGNYRGALCTRVRSLTTGLNGLIFRGNGLSDRELFDQHTIVDMSRIGSSETKALIMGLLVMKLSEYRMTSGRINSSLTHVTVLEEAHNLLKRTSTEQSADSANVLGKAVEMLTNSIAEMRTYGEGFVIADQAPSLLDMAVIRNTNTKIILRLPEQSDRELVGHAANLNEDQIQELSRLKRGVAAVYQSDWIEPVLVHINKCKLKETQYTVQGADIPLGEADAKQRVLELLVHGYLPDSRQPEPELIEHCLDAFPASIQGNIRKLLDEYTRTNHLLLWDQANVFELARQVTELLGLRETVRTHIIEAQNNDELTDRMLRTVEGSLPHSNEQFTLCICSFLLIGVTYKENALPIYQKWCESLNNKYIQEGELL